jgi:hypothetical protein
MAAAAAGLVAEEIGPAVGALALGEAFKGLGNAASGAAAGAGMAIAGIANAAGQAVKGLGDAVGHAGSSRDGTLKFRRKERDRVDRASGQIIPGRESSIELNPANLAAAGIGLALAAGVFCMVKHGPINTFLYGCEGAAAREKQGKTGGPPGGIFGGLFAPPAPGPNVVIDVNATSSTQTNTSTTTNNGAPSGGGAPSAPVVPPFAFPSPYDVGGPPLPAPSKNSNSNVSPFLSAQDNAQMAPFQLPPPAAAPAAPPLSLGDYAALQGEGPAPMLDSTVTGPGKPGGFSAPGPVPLPPLLAPDSGGGLIPDLGGGFPSGLDVPDFGPSIGIVDQRMNAGW